MISEVDADLVVDRLLASRESGEAFRAHAVTLLAELPGYNWSGVYRLEGDSLVLDAYVGAATDHTRIPVGRGVCGTAALENKNQVIGDVRELSNYLACSTLTRSEIVVLVRCGEEILGQIDVDGHTLGAFDRSDELMLERFAHALADRWT